MPDLAPELQARVDRVKARLTVSELVGKHVKLSGRAGARSRRGKCPFHGSNSDSFSVSDDKGFAHCFGCQWHGDVITFVRAFFGLSFLEALADCEAAAGISGELAERQAAPLHREKQATPAKARRELVEPVDMGRWIWKHAREDPGAVRRYFAGRGIPESALAAARLQAFRYMADCPCVLWEAGADPRKVINAPAVIALVCEPVMVPPPGLPAGDGQAASADEPARLEWIPVGVHVTYLSPDGTATMKRRKPWAKAGDEKPWLPKRRMLGPVGRGAVVLGEYGPDAELWIGEGNETVLSAMALGAAAGGAVGLAVLSLDNMQGRALKWRDGTWPLYDIRPDPDRPPFLVPGHRGKAVGLVDSDMSPLKRQRVCEAKGARPLERAITGAERATICAELFVKDWRAAGCPAEALRAPAGMDFNDAIQEAV